MRLNGMMGESRVRITSFQSLCATARSIASSRGRFFSCRVAQSRKNVRVIRRLPTEPRPLPAKTSTVPPQNP